MKSWVASVSSTRVNASFTIVRTPPTRMGEILVRSEGTSSSTSCSMSTASSTWSVR